jgi:ABC-type multidrug transport system fused ATPase/permease subunit
MVLTIAHKINTLMKNDRILVLDKGKIVECDTISNLLQNPKSIFT